MSPKQRDFIVTLAAERQLPGDEKGAYVRSLVAGTAREPSPAQASAIITWLMALPRTAEVDVPAGRYALQHPTRLIVEFFKVDRPTEGEWAGRTFVKQQASDDLYPVRGARAKEVLARIAEDPRAAMLRYGHELGRCGNCGRTLTDLVSRTMGIGPDCADNLGIERITEEEALVLMRVASAPVEGEAVTPTPPPATDAEWQEQEEQRRYEARANLYDGPSTDKQGVPHGVGGWRARKRYAEDSLRGESRTVKPAVLSILEGDLPGETWEDIFGGAA